VPAIIRSFSNELTARTPATYPPPPPAAPPLSGAVGSSQEYPALPCKITYILKTLSGTSNVVLVVYVDI
jgi:hypothetical protein